MYSKKRPKWTVDSVKNTLTPLSVITVKDPSRTIVTDSTITTGSKFGPFPGKDAVQSKFNNWMQFVTGVQSLDESNLVSFIYDKQLYFYCIRSIHPGMELFVWAGVKRNHLLEAQWLSREVQRALLKCTFLCQDCDSTYSSHYGLFAHWSMLHCPIERKIPRTYCKCPYCPRILSNRQNLRMHVLLHLGITKEPTKNTKAKMLSRLRASKSREKITTDESDDDDDDDEEYWGNVVNPGILCDICGMCFRVQSHLENHKKRLHHGENKREAESTSSSSTSSTDQSE